MEMVEVKAEIVFTTQLMIVHKDSPLYYGDRLNILRDGLIFH